MSHQFSHFLNHSPFVYLPDCKAFLAFIDDVIFDWPYRMSKVNRVEIHQALPSQFSLLASFSIGKVPFKELDSRVLMLVNLIP